MATFTTFEDLPVEIKQKIRRIQGIASSQRTTAEAAVLTAYNDALENEVLERNAALEITRAQGVTLPTGLSGFAKSAVFLKTDVAAGTQAMYENTGDTTTAAWNLIGAINTTDIADGAVTSQKLDLVETGADAYAGSSSYQILAPDLELDAAAGGTDGDPAFLAPVMGNLLGDALTATGNYLAGLIGAISVTGAKATKYPAAGVLGIAMDGVTDIDAIICALIDGSDPSAQTNARAAFGVRMINNHASSGVEYGLDLYDAGDTDIMSSAEPFKVTKAIERTPAQICRLEGSGAPVDGTTGDNFAAKGSTYIDTATGLAYLNTGTAADPVWKRITPSHVVVFAGEFTTAGGDANEAITVTGALATDLVHVTMHTKGASPVTILQAQADADVINVVMSGDPSTDHVLTYSVLRAV